MAEMNQLAAQAKQFWATRSNNQRIFLGVGTVATLALVAFFANLMSTPDFKPLMNGLEAADAQAISAELTAKKIPFQLSPDGKSISVPADQVDAARLDVAGTQTTHSGRMGFEIFDKVSWGQTEFDEKVNYQRALEGELERTIMTLGGVKSARVHLVMATDSVFLDRERSAKASVTLKLGADGLTHEETSSIQRLVSGAVEGLKPTDVSIIDADSNKSLGYSDTGSGEDGVERQMTQRLVATLGPAVGADHLRATVNLEYEPGTTEESVEKYDPSVSVPLSVQRSEEHSGDSAVGGVAGTTSNVPNSTPNVPSPTDDGTTQTSKTENATYGVNKTTRHSVLPAGRIRRITAAVLIDDSVTQHQGPNGKWTQARSHRSAAELKQLETLAANAIGIDLTRGDVISIQNMAFSHTEEPDAPLPTALDRARKGMADNSTIVRYAMLMVLFVLAYFLMIRPVQKKVLAAEVPDQPQPSLPQPAVARSLPIPTANDTARTNALKEHLIAQVKVEPANSARLVQAWLREEAR